MGIMKTRISALHEKLNLRLLRYMRDCVSSIKKQLLCHNKQIYDTTANSFTQHSKMAVPLTALRIIISEFKNKDDIIRQILMLKSKGDF